MIRPAPLLQARRTRLDTSGGERLILLVLGLVTCLLAHETSYLVRFGPGAGFDTAMSLRGHDGYWLALVMGVVAAATALGLVSVHQLRRLRREAGDAPDIDPAGGPRTLLRLTARGWAQVAILGIGLFTVQENLEALIAGHLAPGLGVVLVDGGIALLAIIGSALLVALVMALVRWRRLVLLGRLRRHAERWPRLDAARPRQPADGRSSTLVLLGVRLMRAPPSTAFRPAR